MLMFMVNKTFILGVLKVMVIMGISLYIYAKILFSDFLWRHPVLRFIFELMMIPLALVLADYIARSSIAIALILEKCKRGVKYVSIQNLF